MTVQYLIDSENVGDFWIPLLELPADQTELIVFYTRNSPHMSYESLIKLKESDRTVTFIKCYEGTNALDFQLVSELGYRISKNEYSRFVIVTNDTGFDAAVKYWRRSRKSVKRITGKECRNLERRKKEDLEEKTPVVRTQSAVRPAIETEAENEETAAAVTVPAEEILDARPSRPVLRDAESAMQPDSEESDYSMDSFYAEDTDLESEETDSAYEIELEEIESDFEPVDQFDHAEESLEDNFTEKEELPFDNGDESHSAPDYCEETEASDLFDVSAHAENGDEPETESDRETENEEEEFSLPTPGKDTGDNEGFDTDFKMNEKETADDTDADRFEESFPEADAAVTDEPFVTDIAHGGFEQDNQEDTVYAAAVPAEKNPVDDSDGAEKPGPADNGKKNQKKGASTVEDTAAQPSDSEAFVKTEVEEPDSEQEDSPEDSSHRSRSRRSRSRRTRSGSRKQEQTESAETTAAEERKNGQHDEKMPDRADAAASDEIAGDAGNPIMNVSEMAEVPGDEEIARIVACIGPDNLAELHNQLATIYGDQGKEIYLSIKNNSRALPVLKPDLKQKFAYYCEIIFARSDYSGEYPADISEYLLNVREKLNNLNSLRYALQKHYGKEKGRRFYFLLKPFAKTMYQM